MKVLKAGKWHDKWSLEVACGACEAKLLAEESDLDSRWKKGTVHYVTCPECKGEIIIPAEKLAPRLVEKLRKYVPSYSIDW